MRHSWVEGGRDPGCGILAAMPELITQPSRVAAAGQPPKLIDEYVGRANTGQDGLSIAHMRSPSGWAEPGQRPAFDEFIAQGVPLRIVYQTAGMWATSGRALWRKRITLTEFVLVTRQ